jgi:hypothetical protein
MILIINHPKNRLRLGDNRSGILLQKYNNDDLVIHQHYIMDVLISQIYNKIIKILIGR